MRTLTLTLVRATLVVALSCAVGCRQDRVRVEMDATGEGATRSFASNALGASDVDRLRGVYASEPEVDREVGGTRFTAAFGHDLPSELGNRNGLVELRSRLGSTHFYFESFGFAGSLWAQLEARMHAGELWIRLFARWAERQIEDPSKREEWKAYVERELIPLLDDAMLLWSTQSATVRSARVGLDVRDDNDLSPITDDERFAQRVGMPLLLMLAERNFLTTEDAQRVLLLSVDGNATKSERSWVVDHVLVPAMLRQVHRFRPNVKSFEATELVPMALSFWLYATSSPDRRDILLASPAISDADKARIRAGDLRIALPPPFGIDPMSKPKRTEADVHLRTGMRPFAHNGKWDEASREVRFTSSFTEASRRSTLFPPIYYAAWSEPDEATQERLFGGVILFGSDLAAYCMWRETLPPELGLRWESALDELERTGTTSSLVAFEREIGDVRPMPAVLTDWLRERTSPRVARDARPVN
ncbi:MAG: hypothetical protein U0572_11005 [Phycisphaerales bacterium]